jgi:NADPH-dependent ferric siderophore reductase
MNPTIRATVTEVERVSPRLVRLTLRPDVPGSWRSTGVGDEFVHVDVGATTPDADGHAERHYTVSRAVDDSLEIEVVIHGHGPGSAWGAAARPGDAVLLSKPKGYYAPPPESRSRVLLGDATAVPAIARILAQAGEDEEFQCVIEVPSMDDARALPSAATVHVDWRVAGNGVGASVMVDAVRELAARGDGPGAPDAGAPYVWVACESAESRRARLALRSEWGLQPRNYRVVGYWHADLERLLARWAGLTDEQRARYEDIWRDDRTDEENWLELEPYLRSLRI